MFQDSNFNRVIVIFTRVVEMAIPQALDRVVPKWRAGLGDTAHQTTLRFPKLMIVSYSKK